MNGLFTGDFDPITIADIQIARKIKKEKNLEYVYFYLHKEGQTDYDCRLEMLKRMIKPYRKFKILEKTIQKNACIVIEENKQVQKAVRQGNFQYIPKYIRSYIMEKGLYCRSIIQTQLKESRYLHSLSVAELAKRIAKTNQLDEEKAYLIGIYHDIAKNLSVQDNKTYISIYKPYEKDYPQAVWHQYIGYYLLKHYYCLKDKDMLKAIRHHCLGDDDSPYSQLIFVADKLDPSRGYDSSKEIALALQNLKNGFATVKLQNENYLKKEGVK